MTTKDSGYSELANPREFIANCLFLVNEQSLLHDINQIDDNYNTKYLYQTFYTSVAYVANAVKGPMQISEGPVIANTDLEDGWYFIPAGFVGWIQSPQPIQYHVDEKNKISFKAPFLILNEKESIRFIKIPDVLNMDINFVMAVRWHFIGELALNNTAIQSKLPAILQNKMMYLNSARKNAKKINMDGYTRTSYNYGYL